MAWELSDKSPPTRSHLLSFPNTSRTWEQAFNHVRPGWPLSFKSPWCDPVLRLSLATWPTLTISGSLHQKSPQLNTISFELLNLNISDSSHHTKEIFHDAEKFKLWKTLAGQILRKSEKTNDLGSTWMKVLTLTSVRNYLGKSFTYFASSTKAPFDIFRMLIHMKWY